MKKIIFILNIILLPSLWADELNSTFTESGNLTDEQVTQSKDFVHQGIKDKVYSDGCKDLKNCQVEDDNGVERIIGQVYATALPAVLGQFKSSDKADTASAEPAKDNNSTADSASAGDTQEDGTDWCMIAAMGYEMFSTLFQEKLQGKAAKTEQEISDAQLRTLVNLRETHKARKKSANYQAAAYGAITTCYAIMIASPQLSLNWQTGIKMSGAALLATLYKRKADKHDGLADKVQKVINALPHSGACNPWTQSTCFCTEESSKERYPAEYQEVCVLNGGDFNTPKMAMGCAATDSSGKVTYDEQCRCKQTNSCLSARISAFTPNLSDATNAMRQMSTGYELLDSGLYDEAKLNSYSTNAAAMGSKIVREISNPNSAPIALNNEQKKLAKELSGLVAPELAAQIASSQPRYPENSIANGPTESKAILSQVENTEQGLQAKAVKGSYKSSATTSKSSSKTEKGFTMPNLLAKKSAPTSNVEIINFANKAISNADVNNSPSTPIFDIISNRYRHAWKRLDDKAQTLE